MTSNINIKYCKKCIMPFTKPDLAFGSSGICSGCTAFAKRDEVNWDERAKKFLSILDTYKKNSTSNYNSIVPCSGGKDSHYQVLKLLELGMNPLCVNASTDKLSELGRHNLDNIKKLGVDLIEINTDKVLRRKINKFTLETVGDISWAEHLTIFTIPVKVAVWMKIPLIIWGENPQNENGGPIEKQNEINLNRRWLEEFGGLLGLRVSDITNILNIPEEKMTLYTYPTSEELKKNKINGLFLGQFYFWDGVSNYEMAKKNGFKEYHKDLGGAIVRYENLDNLQMRIHDYFKYLKYGYDRVTDWCCWHIRRGRMKREEALKINLEKSGKFPNTYMDVALDEILREIDCSKEEFISICDKFTNKKIFKCNNDRKIIKKTDGSLLINNLDN